MTAVTVPDLWREVAYRRADTITSRHWARGKSMKGFTAEDPWTRRRRGMLAEVGLAIFLGHVELWNPDLNAFHPAPDVFPNWEVRSGPFFAQGEGDRGKPDDPLAHIVSVDVVGTDVNIRGWAPVSLFRDEGLFVERTEDWDQDHWTLDPMWRKYPDEARELSDAWWATIPEEEGGAVWDRRTCREGFWSHVLATPVQEQKWADRIVAKKRKPVKFRDQAVTWAEDVKDGRDFPTREALMDAIMAVA